MFRPRQRDGRVARDVRCLLTHREPIDEVQRVIVIGVVVDRMNGVVEIGCASDVNRLRSGQRRRCHRKDHDQAGNPRAPMNRHLR